MGSRGGKRKGAGRKAGDPLLIKKPVGLRMSVWIKAWLDEQDEPNITLIEKALKAQYKLTPPKTTGEKHGNDSI